MDLFSFLQFPAGGGKKGGIFDGERGKVGELGQDFNIGMGQFLVRGKFIAESKYADYLSVEDERHTGKRGNQPFGQRGKAVFPVVVVINKQRLTRLPDNAGHPLAQPHLMVKYLGKNTPAHARNHFAALRVEQLKKTGICANQRARPLDDVLQEGVEVQLGEQFEGRFLKRRQVGVLPADGFLGFLALADVAHDDEQDFPAAEGLHSAAYFHGETFAVGAQVVGFEGGAGNRFFLAYLNGLVGRNQVGNRLGEEFLAGVAIHFASAVIDRQDSAVEGFDQDGILHAVEDGTVVFLAFAERRLRLYTFCYIQSSYEDGGASVVRERVGVDFDINDASILAAVPPNARMLKRGAFSFQVFQQARHILLRADVGNAHGEEFLARVAVLVHSGVVDGKETIRLQVIDPHGQRIVLKQYFLPRAIVSLG